MTEIELSKFKRKVKAECAKIGMEPNKESSRDLSFEKYLWSFATVCLSIDTWNEKLTVERYYDSEIVNERRQVTEVYDFKKLDMAIKKCHFLIKTIVNDEPILGGIE